MPTPLPALPTGQMLLDPARAWGLRSKILLLLGQGGCLLLLQPWDKAGGDSLGAAAPLRNPPAAAELSAGLSSNSSGAQLSLLPCLGGVWPGGGQGFDVPSPQARTGDA